MDDMALKLQELAEIDLYKLFKLTSKCTISDIKKQYKIFVIKYHPDKKQGNAEKFDLIQQAYKILMDDELRAKYDDLHRLYKDSGSDFLDLKKGFDKKKDIGKKSEDEAKAEFKKKWDELNKKHNVQTGDVKTMKMMPMDTTHKLSDLKSARTNLPTQEVIFDKRDFSLDKFNNAFEMFKQTQPQKTDLISYKVGAMDLTTTNFATFDAFDNLYTESKDGTIFDVKSASLDEAFNDPIVINKDQLSNIDTTGHYSDHNYKTNDYNKSLEERMRQYNEQTTQLSKMNMSDFKKDDFMGYGIYDKLTDKNTKLLRDQ